MALTLMTAPACLLLTALDDLPQRWVGTGNVALRITNNTTGYVFYNGISEGVDALGWLEAGDWEIQIYGIQGYSDHTPWTDGVHYTNDWSGEGTFTMTLPAPSALAGFAILGLCSHRRRR